MTRIKQFNRFELKYLINQEQQEGMIRGLTPFMQYDPHSADGHRYNVTSLYYDTAAYKAYWNKIDGHRFRRKIRIRTYDTLPLTADSPCFTEIKQHLNNTIAKKRLRLPYGGAAALCGTGQPTAAESETDRAVSEEIQYLSRTLQLQPACIVSYQRLAFNGTDYQPSLRITFDTQLKCRGHELTLLQPAENRYFVSPDHCIMEIKVNYHVPYWITRLIGEYQCTLRSFSKYCTALAQSRLILNHQQITY